MKSRQILRSTITERGQTTIPAQVRKALRLKAHQRLTYEICDDSVVVRAETENIMDLAGSLRSGVPTGSKSEERAQARRARLRRYQ
jgi:antitoxin PrlF